MVLDTRIVLRCFVLAGNAAKTKSLASSTDTCGLGGCAKAKVDNAKKTTQFAMNLMSNILHRFTAKFCDDCPDMGNVAHCLLLKVWFNTEKAIPLSCPSPKIGKPHEGLIFQPKYIYEII